MTTFVHFKQLHSLTCGNGVPQGLAVDPRLYVFIVFYSPVLLFH